MHGHHARGVPGVLTVNFVRASGYAALVSVRGWSLSRNFLRVNYLKPYDVS